ncbi:Uncharacterised protein [uncultured archaeon]|nr:Uncharacterised protein [uncultured archaeon]
MFGGDFGVNSSFKEMESGFGIGSAQQLSELRKALSAGYQANTAFTTTGGPLRVQSLESSLKVLTNTQRHYKFWQEVPKTPAYSTVEEYNTLTQYGNDNGGFNFEGVLPQQDDSTYTRNIALVKFLGTTRQISHPLSLVKPAHGDVIALENQNGILWILRRLESAFFLGNSTLMPTGQEGAEFNGLSQQIDANNVIDLLGNPLSEEVIEEGANVVAQNYGTPTHMFLALRAMADFAKTVYGKERFMPQQASVDANGNLGYFIQSIVTQAGPIGIRPDVFIQNTPNPVTNVANGAPVAPSGGAVVVGAATGTDGNFYKDGAGDYAYAVALGNNYGESSATAGNVAQTLTSADLQKHIPLTITMPVAGANAPQYMSIYRTQPGGAVLYRIARVGLAATGGVINATQTFNDVDTIMAGTSEAYLGEMSTHVLHFKQLSPLAKMDLAIVGPAYRWMILLYGVLVVYAPKKWVKYINIGSSSAVATV